MNYGCVRKTTECSDSDAVSTSDSFPGDVWIKEVPPRRRLGVRARYFAKVSGI